MSGGSLSQYGAGMETGIPCAAPVPERSRPRWLRVLLVLGVTTLAFLLRWFRIGSDGLWIDEAFSVWLARQPLREMVSWVARVDHHPPLYYALLHGWVDLLGPGQASVRFLSALFGALTVPVIYALGRHLAGERGGLTAALLLALSPFHVRFSQEARMYALLTLLASLALWAFLRIYDRIFDRRTRPSPASTSPSPLPWIGYVIFTAAMLWTQNTAVFLPLTLNLLVLGRVVIASRSSSSGRRRRSGFPLKSSLAPGLRRWFTAQAVLLLLWAPWLPSLASQAADVYRRFWLPPPTPGTIVSILGELLYAFSPWPFLVTVLVVLALAGLAVWGLWNLHRRTDHAGLLAALLMLPLAGQALISLWRPILYARTVVWTAIPLYLMVAVGVSRLGVASLSSLTPRRVVPAALAVLVAINAAALCHYYTAFEKEAWDDAADLVAHRVQPGDLLLFNGAWGQIPFDYYFARRYNPQLDPPVVAHGLPVDLFDRGVLEPRMTEDDLPRLRALVAGRDRVWLVYSHQWYTDPEGLVPPALAAALNLQQTWTFKGLQVRLYVER